MIWGDLAPRRVEVVAALALPAGSMGSADANLTWTFSYDFALPLSAWTPTAGL
jgi:hypothetical protein